MKHRTGEHGRGDVYTNTVESFFAILRRGINGTYHAVSKRHLDRYVPDSEYRWNSRQPERWGRVLHGRFAVRTGGG